MSKIENAKTYLGKELENIFFRPIFADEGARELGIKVMYNMPAPTRLHFWHRPEDVLRKYTSAGWNGSASAERYTKTVELQRVKAEMSYSADEYFSLVYDSIAQSALTQLDDLTGTELEAAETALFRNAILESVRATMWLGKTTREGVLNTFDGFLHRIISDINSRDIPAEVYESVTTATAVTRQKSVRDNASEELRNMRAEGQLVFFVTTDVRDAYEESLEAADNEAAYHLRQTGPGSLMFKGIPVVDMKLNSYLPRCYDLGVSFILLTDRRNLALALNTGDFPGSEVRMWYNPDLMENRQRAIFMAGCDYLLPELVSIGYAK